jgi:hypothetical protein
MKASGLGGLIVIFKSSGNPPVVPESFFKTTSRGLSTSLPFDLDFRRKDYAFERSLGVYRIVPMTPDHPGREFIYQQVIHARLFPQAAISLGAMACRPNMAARPAAPTAGRPPGYTRTIGDVRITLSTTAKAPANLDANPAANLGRDAAQVFGGPLTLRSRPNGRRQFQEFDIRVNFARPFPYNPAAGNLLVQVVVPLGAAAEGSLPPIDAARQGETVACRIWTPRG